MDTLYSTSTRNKNRKNDNWRTKKMNRIIAAANNTIDTLDAELVASRKECEALSETNAHLRKTIDTLNNRIDTLIEILAHKMQPA